MNEEETKKERGSFGAGLFTGILITVAAAILLLLIMLRAGVLSEGKKGPEALSEAANAKLSAIEGLVELHYFGEVDPELENEAVYKGYIAGLEDPYSEYFTAEEYEEQQEKVTKEYYGIGATLTQEKDNGIVTIVYVYEGTPAERAGLKEGDIIVSADGLEATTMDLDEFVDHVRGEEGTTVQLVIRREGEKDLLTFDVEREEVKLPTVDSELLDGKIGYILISRFALNTAEEFREAVSELEKKGMKAMIVDLRYNPGGLLGSVVEILDEILPEGTVVYTEDKYGNRQDEVSDAEHYMDLPIAILISENSASASEIMAGAIRDYEYGTLIGTTTYGKGVVQQTFPMTDGSAVKLTVEKYFTPKGENIQDKGIDPDIELEYEFLGKEDEAYDYAKDNQIVKAIQVLEKEL